MQNGSKSVDLNDVLFPVVLADAVASHPAVGKLRTAYHAVVDQERAHVLSVVSDDYKLVTNREAIERGKRVFREVFSQNTFDGLEVYSVVQPKSRSFCHVDFTLKDHRFSFGSKDEWVPFLRVTNSYNKTKPLRFDFGFCRDICRNGLILDPKKATVKRYHTKAMGRVSDLEGLNLDAVQAIETEFLEKLHDLKRFAAPPTLMLPLTCKVFGLDATEDQLSRPQSLKRMARIGRQVERLTDGYFRDLGHNGYAALNVLTDFASRPECLGVSALPQTHTFQSRSGRWVDEFIAAVKGERFDFSQYVAEHAETTERIRRAMSLCPDDSRAKETM